MTDTICPGQLRQWIETLLRGRPRKGDLILILQTEATVLDKQGGSRPLHWAYMHMSTGQDDWDSDDFLLEKTQLVVEGS